MHITLADIEAMASPGWEECGSDLEVLEDEDLDGFPERGEPEAEPEDGPEKPVRYTDGCREGMTTFEICERLKNERMTPKNRLEQEFLAILRTYPENGRDFKILLWLARGFPYQQAAYRLKRSEKTIRNAARRLRQFRDHGIVKLLPTDQVQTGEALLKPFPPTRAGRPRGGKRKPEPTEITTAEIIVGFDLFGQPVRPRLPRKARKAGPRRPRVRPPIQGQMDLFDLAA